MKRPQIVVGTKMDMPNAAENLEKFKQKLKEDNTLETTPLVTGISSVTHEGLKELMQKTADLLEKTPRFETKSERALKKQEEEKVFDYKEEENTAPDFTITRDEDGVWILGGEKLEKLFKMTNTEHNESMMRFARQLRHMGVDDALREKGAKSGDTVKIDNFMFDFVE